MPRKAEGSVDLSRGIWRARVTCGKRRPSFALPWATDKDRARTRLPVLASLARDLGAARPAPSETTADEILGAVATAPPELVNACADVARQLVAAGRADDAPRLLERILEGGDAKHAEAARGAAATIARGAAIRAGSVGAIRTWGDLANAWLSGELAKAFPLLVGPKRSPNADRSRLKRLLPIIGHVPIVDFEREHADFALATLAATVRARSTLARFAGLIQRVVHLATLAGLRKTNPLPRGWVPRVKDRKQRHHLYPDELARVYAAGAVDLDARVLYAFLATEGTRISEATSRNVAHADLERGAIRVDSNKTDMPRTWRLRPDVVVMLRGYIELRRRRGEVITPSSPLFVNPRGRRRSVTRPEDRVRWTLRVMARRMREDLGRAGIDRPELFETTDTNDDVDVHGLRRTFVTLFLAAGAPDEYIRLRTGHTSNEIERYRIGARSAAELDLDVPPAVDVGIPEVAAVAHELGLRRPPLPPGGRTAFDPMPRQQEPGEGPPSSGPSRGGPAPETSAEASASAPRRALGGRAVSVRKSRIHLADRPRPSSRRRRDRGCGNGTPGAASEEGFEPGSRGVEGIEVRASTTSLPRADASEALADVSASSASATTASPRAALLQSLLDAARAAVAAGDLEAARIAHEAVGKLLGEGEGKGAPVVDLADVRRGRAR
jgi:integrase